MSVLSATREYPYGSRRWKRVNGKPTSTLGDVVTNEFTSDQGSGSVGVIDPANPDMSSASNLYAEPDMIRLLRGHLNRREFPMHAQEAAKLPVPQAGPVTWSTCVICGQPTEDVRLRTYLKTKREALAGHGKLLARALQRAQEWGDHEDMEWMSERIASYREQWHELGHQLSLVEPDDPTLIEVCHDHGRINHRRKPKSTAVVGKMPQLHDLCESSLLADRQRWIVTVRTEYKPTEKSEPVARYYVVLCEKHENLTVRNRGHRDVLNRDFFFMGEPIADWMRYVQQVWEPVEEYLGHFTSLDDAEVHRARWASQINDDLRDQRRAFVDEDHLSSVS